jgi:hypothetical protein
MVALTGEAEPVAISLGSALLQGLAKYVEAIDPGADTPRRVAQLVHSGGELLYAVLLRMEQSDDAVMQRMGQCFTGMVRLDRHGLVQGFTPTMEWALKEARAISRPWHVPPRRLRMSGRPRLRGRRRH